MCAHICKENIEKGREKMHFGGGVVGQVCGKVQSNKMKRNFTEEEIGCQEYKQSSPSNYEKLSLTEAHTQTLKNTHTYPHINTHPHTLKHT